MMTLKMFDRRTSTFILIYFILPRNSKRHILLKSLVEQNYENNEINYFTLCY